MSRTPSLIAASALIATLAAPALAGYGRIAFVTDGSYAGALGGLSGADAKCQAEADGPGAAVPPGTYLAWLSDGTDGPETRFARRAGPFVLPDGAEIATDYADLTDGEIEHPIDVTATGARIATDYYWTGTRTDGATASEIVTCEGWTNGGGAKGMIGNTSKKDGSWSIYSAQHPCNMTHRLVCIQQ